MDSLDVEVLQRAQDWLAGGRQVMLATVVRTWGSAPRPPGAMMALRDDACVAGSVSGGCIEDDLIYRLREEGMPLRPQAVTYGVSAEEARRFGLPCGGTLQLVIEPLDANSQLDALLARMAAGDLVSRELDLTTGRVRLAGARADDELAFDGEVLRCMFGPRYRLLLIGSGQLSAGLAGIAGALDFAVTVCDPREEYAEEWSVSGTTITRDMPDDVVIAMQPDARTAIVALTHDPKLDDLALMEALKSPAFYIAALGSRRTNAARRARLREFDLTQAQVDRLSGPAGLYIGSRTPMEIAVSIAAELVARKNRAAVPAAVKVQHAKERLEALATGVHERAAAIVVPVTM